MPQANPGVDPAVVHFVAIAKDFCQILDTEITPLNRHLAQRILESILVLYAAGLKLPEVDPNPEEDADRIFDSEFRHKFFRTLADQLGGDFHYQKIFDPFDSDGCEAVTASLSDDLSDIYFDLKKGLMRIPDDGMVPANVIWAWAFSLESHWGRHAVSAISAFNSLLHGSHALS